MPRPVGSKNKATLAKMNTKPSDAPKKPSSMAPVGGAVMDAIQEFQDSLVTCGESIANILEQVTADFEALKVACTPASEKSTKTQAVSKPSAKAPPVEEDDDDDDAADEEPDFDSMTVAQLQEYIDENDLDVDLEDYKGLSKKRQAVADAWETAEDEDAEDEDEDDEDEDAEEDDEDDDDWDEPKKPVRATKPAGRSKK